MAIDAFSFTPFGDGSPTWFKGDATPTAGTYQKGDILWNSAPSADGPIAWLCTTGGTTGGTWTPIQALATGSASPSDSGVTWSAGDIVFNSAPTANAPSGWVATTAGAGSAAAFLPFGQTNLTYELTTTATSGTLSSLYAMILLNPASTGTYSLPNVTAYSAGTALFLKNIASGSVTLTPLAANGYDVAAITLAQNASVTLRSGGGTQWYKQS